MAFVAAGASILGGLISSDAAGNAADTQAASTQAGTAEQRRQYDQTRSDQAPYRQTGNAALTQLSDLLGVPTFDAAAYLRANPDVAADPYWSAHAYDHYLQFGQAENRAMPTTAQSGAFGSYARPLTSAEVQLDPGYQFGLDQGLKAQDRQIAAAGGRISGAAVKAAAQYGNDYATTKYDAAYNRVNQARSDRLNRLAALAGIGQTATQQVGSAGQTMATNNANLITAQGNASAAGQLAQGNIWGNTANQLAALYGRKGSSSSSGGWGTNTGGFGTGYPYGNEDYGLFI